MEILHIENLSFTYPQSDKKALDDVSLSINDGDFVVVCGESGCGKTTLLKLIKKEIAPFGKTEGEIRYKGTEINKLDTKTSSCAVGFVMQNPDTQIVADKVWHELSFGLENLGLATEVIRRRVGEMASYFGIEGWFRSNTDELSGGQKQLLNLASVMVMQPEILILDEPTSQLDPIAAADFIATLQKLNRELGLTVILSEHRLEEVFPVADKVLLMHDGSVKLFDSPRSVSVQIAKLGKNSRFLAGMPCAVRIFAATGKDEYPCPLTVKEGRSYITGQFKNEIKSAGFDCRTREGKPVIELKGVWHRYGKNEPDVLRSAQLTICSSEIFCILGGNGSGKTTAMGVISGIEKAYRGSVRIKGKKIESYKGNELYKQCIAYLMQNPLTAFTEDSVRKDFEVISDEFFCEVSRLGIEKLLDRHPYDLSGGEQQKCAIAKMLLTKPEILLLDEPTKGLDVRSKAELRKILCELRSEGMTVVIVTHDVEFAAEAADRCALMFDGEFISEDTPEKFFADNSFYTTAANRISRGYYDGAVTSEAVAQLCRINGEKNA